MGLVAAGVWLLGATAAQAAPAYPFEHTFEQADGQTITLVRWGDEYISGWETRTGRTVAFNAGTDNWEYAQRGADGTLQPSGHVVARDRAPASSFELRPTRADHEQAKQEFHAGGDEAPPLSSTSPSQSSSSSLESSSGEMMASSSDAWGLGTRLLFLALEFNDVPCTFTPADHQANLFGDAFTGAGNLRDYYWENSHQTLELDGTVIGDADGGCITLDEDRDYYNQSRDRAREGIVEAVGKADGHVDFSMFDNTGDGIVDELGIIYAGGAPNDGCYVEEDDPEGLWPHRSTVSATATDDGVEVRGYILNSEVTRPANVGANGGANCTVIQTVGLFAHELGHSLGLPDLYDTTVRTGGVSHWSAMALHFRSIQNLADTPGHFDPWSKWVLGWVDPDDRTNFEGNGPIQDVTHTGHVILLGENPGGPELGGNEGEYFLIENRQLTGFNQALEGCGLLIWHIDESMPGNANSGIDEDDPLGPFDPDEHRLVDLRQADGQRDLHFNASSDDGDPFPGSTGNRNWTDATGVPNARYYDGSASGFRVTSISDCAPAMTANFGAPFVDLHINKAANKTEAVAGEDIQYTIVVTNLGPGTGSNVTVVDELPDQLELIAAPDWCTTSGQTVTCNLGQLMDGEVRSFFLQVRVRPDAVVNTGGSLHITNTATVSSDQPDNNLLNNTKSVNTVLVERADLGVTKTCKPDGLADAGTTAFCDLTVHNFGPSHARSVVMTDDIVAVIPFNVTSATGCSTSAISNGTRVTCNIGTLAAGASQTRTVSFTTNQGGDINDTLRVTSPTPDPNAGNDVAHGRVTFRAVADLALLKSADPEPATAGEDITYTLTATNNGPSTAQNVRIVDALPAQVTVVSVTPSAGGSCTVGTPGNAAAPTGCNVGSLASGASATVTIVVTINPGFTGVLTNDGWVSSDTHDPNNANNLAKTETPVEGLADVSVTKSSTPDPAVAGEVMHHTIVVTNHGPSVARNVRVTDELPDGTTFEKVSVQGNQGTCALVDVPPDTVICDLIDLAPGQSVTVFIDVLVAADVPDGATLTNTATVTSSTPDPDPSNNVDDATVDVVAVADLWLTKEASFEVNNSSYTIEYTLTIGNDGPSDAQDVMIIDDLPSVTTGGGQEKVSFVHASVECTFDADDHQVTCDIGTLAEGETYEVKIFIQLAGNGDLYNVARVESSTTDPALANNEDDHLLKLKGGTTKGGGGNGGGGGGGNGKGPNK